MKLSFRTALLAALLPVGLILAAPRLHADETPHLVPAPAIDQPAATAPRLESIVLSGGCFWGVQGVFEHVKGVTQALSGYTGGAPDTAQYETVSTGSTGHAESVKVTYDPAQVSLGQLLRIFFSVTLDPTRKDGQGPDEGTQYRSEIWVSSPEQAHVAKAYIAQLDQAHAFQAPIATRVDALHGFFPAEAYHQDYLVLNPDAGYIEANDMPKVQALQQLFPAQWSAQPKTVSALPATSRG
ncbi:peptide-methionine (S)-S-oxide reductase MsrA [Lichenicoccus roseus]|uniref:Peptide methionine sulfoxide reductase MsrA n=1 Tax=Lichenicoccus roseus TaxID=2683649 RepID=A0A5R9J2Q0_9PROT|nr:peptide-methionine (S)-S-oxide reductase MsrA [Lichenicoccus roseus]TLU71832.1 peptide-methionine (S)-S-oxide reductase MsrA [Lichenicoccus roseus]